MSTIARVADSVSLDGIREVGAHVYKMSRAKKMIEPYNPLSAGLAADFCPQK